MRPLLVIVAAVVCVCAQLAPPAGAQYMTFYHFLRVPVNGPVVIDRAVAADEQGNQFGGDPGDAAHIDKLCVSFHNTDPRPATAVQFQFVFFNAGGTRTGSQSLTRTGTFSTGARVAAADDRRVRPEDCTPINVPRGEPTVVAYYPNRVDFSDGTAWTVHDVVLPDRAVPGTLVPDISAPKTIDASIEPVVTRTAATCAMPAVPSIPAVQSVRVLVQPGAPIGDGLFHIGDAATCPGAAPGAGDSAALAAVEHYPAAIVGPQIFQVEVPVIAVSATCTAPARLLSRRLLNGRDDDTLDRLAPPGDYTGNVHVTIRADGFPTDPKLTHSTGRPEYDNSLKYSAMESRYWPALENGKPVAGDFDFAMRWSIVRAPAGGYVVRTYGAALTPLPASCAPA